MIVRCSFDAGSLRKKYVLFYRNMLLITYPLTTFLIFEMFQLIIINIIIIGHKEKNINSIWSDFY